MSEEGPCPQCGSADVAPILYGLPGPDAMDAAKAGSLILGGCEPHESSHGCRSCGARWGGSTSATHTPDTGESPVRIAEAFNTYFRNWSIKISPSHVRPGARASLGNRGWGINYLVEADDSGPYLEFYATHRMTDDRHVLISSSGEIEHLDAITGMYFYDPNVGGARERASRRNIERNQRVAGVRDAN
jgi:hypothetical protein